MHWDQFVAVANGKAGKSIYRTKLDRQAAL